MEVVGTLGVTNTLAYNSTLVERVVTEIYDIGPYSFFTSSKLNWICRFTAQKRFFVLKIKLLNRILSSTIELENCEIDGNTEI